GKVSAEISTRTGRGSFPRTPVESGARPISITMADHEGRSASFILTMALSITRKIITRRSLRSKDHGNESHHQGERFFFGCGAAHLSGARTWISCALWRKS